MSTEQFNTQEDLLKLLANDQVPFPNEFKKLVTSIESHNILAKVFLLEGVPFVFKNSPMKYLIFREQVAENFDVGSQDVCIVGSAKLGFSPSPHQFGKSFNEVSDVDVVVVSEDLFYKGSNELFSVLNRLEPSVHHIRPFLDTNLEKSTKQNKPVISLSNWKKVKEAIRNFTHNNFNPGSLPSDNHLRIKIFEKIDSTSGLFLALEPQVFVSKIRARIFRNWKATENYYANTLREAKNFFTGGNTESEDEEIEEVLQSNIENKG
jgi:hypothetical protein